MCSRAGLHAMDKRQISCPSRELNSGRPARSLVAISTKLSSSNVFALLLALDFHFVNADF
jgi:hypothetical protein